MADVQEEKFVKAGEFEVGKLYRTQIPFTSRDDGEDAHSRWLLYLGKSHSFDGYAIVYLFSSTTQLHHFEDGGDRRNSNFKIYDKGTFGFTEKCAICFDDIIDYLTEKDIEAYNPVLMGTFTKDGLKEAYAKIQVSPRIKPLEKIDIHNNLGNIGVTGLTMPKRRRR